MMDAPQYARADAIAEPRRKLHRLFRWLILISLVVICGVLAVAAEYGARNYERRRSTAPDYFPSMYYPHRRLRYGLVPNLDYYGWFKINSLGFRGREFSAQKAPGTFRIICLGASTTFDVGSVGRQNRPWPEVLEDSLRRQLGRPSIEVLNLGLPGATSLDSLIDLQMRALSFDPDLLIVYQGHNDFVYSVPPPRPVQSDLFPLEDRPRGAIERWLVVHSLLYAKTEGRISDLLARITGIFSSGASAGTQAVNRDQALEQGLSTFRSNLKSIAAITRANGIVLVLPKIIVPVPQGDQAARCNVCEHLPDAYGGLPIEKVTSMFAQYNGALSELATGTDVRSLVTDGFVPSADEFYHDPVHFGPKGSMRMGERLAESIAPIVQASLPHDISRVQQR